MGTGDTLDKKNPVDGAEDWRAPETPKSGGDTPEAAAKRAADYEEMVADEAAYVAEVIPRLQEHINKIPEQPSAETNNQRRRREMTPEELDAEYRLGEEQAAAYLAAQAEEPVAEVLDEGDAQIEAFDTLVNVFERQHDMQYLLRIVTEEQAKGDLVRDSAKASLKPIFDQLKNIQNMKGVPPEKRARLEEEWKRISRAVGMINRGMVDHTR